MQTHGTLIICTIQLKCGEKYALSIAICYSNIGVDFDLNGQTGAFGRFQPTKCQEK